MKKIKQVGVIIFWLLVITNSHAQDPSFSQFFSSPLTINPALTANINGKWRVISNYRNQWSGPGKPFSTGTISYDSKIFQDVAGNFVDENTRVGIGGMMMYDESTGGALKSNYASLNATANIRLMKKEGYEQNGARIRHIDKANNDEVAEQRLGVGLESMPRRERASFLPGRFVPLRRGPYALFASESGGTYMLRAGRLYNDRNKPIPGITGRIKLKQKTVELITAEKDVQVFRLGEDEKDKDKEKP